MKSYRWIHFEIDPHGKTLCGKDDFKVLRTEKKHKVTCKRCIKALKEKHWYCKEHGFIEDVNVTHDETCGLCGRTAIA